MTPSSATPRRKYTKWDLSSSHHSSTLISFKKYQFRTKGSAADLDPQLIGLLDTDLQILNYVSGSVQFVKDLKTLK
jgi:hypothetical protein